MRTGVRPIQWVKGKPRIDPRNYPALWTPAQSYIWDKATFEVPSDVSEERVQFYAPKWRNIYGKQLEAEGFTVLALDGPKVYQGGLAEAIVDPDRRRYVIWAKVRRRPALVHVDVPDAIVPGLVGDGLRLEE